MRAHAVLALRALGLGDFLTGLPALRLLRSAFPDSRLILAAPEAFRPLIELSGAADALLPSFDLAPLPDPGVPIDVAVDLHGKGPESLALLEALRPERVVGFAQASVGRPGPVWRPHEHEAARWTRLVQEAFGPLADAGGPAGSIPLPDGPEYDDLPAGAAIVHPGAAAPSRRWPADRFAAVCRSLCAQGHRVLVTGGPAESALARQVAQESGAEPMIGLSLMQLLALVGRAGLVVSGDTGIAHIASNYRTPSVVLFGPVSPAGWGPPDDPRHRVLWHGRGDGDPHGMQPDPALLRITIDEVQAQIALLAHLRLSAFQNA